MFDIGRKKKEDGIYFIGQNADDVTGSCTYIKYNGKKILLECGLFQNNNYLDSYNINSQKFPFKPSEIDYVFVGHTHVDHIGLLPRLIKEGFNGKIIASHATAQLMKPLLYNCAFILLSEANALSFKYKRNYSPIYTEEDVATTLNYIYEYDNVHELYVLDEIVSFKWFENTQLFGKKVLVTRDKRQAREFSDKIEKIGGFAIELPFIKIESTLDKIDREMLKSYSTLLFNSPNGVREFMNKIEDIRDIAHLKIGAVGSKTKELLERYKIKADFIPKEYLVEKLAKEAIHYTAVGEKILIITSDISPCDTKKLNSIYDRHFDKIVAYKTKKIIRDKEEVLDTLKKVEIVTFLSSSTVDAFMESIEYDIESVKNIKFASIGPVTSETIKKYGLTVDFEAKVYDANGIIEAIK